MCTRRSQDTSTGPGTISRYLQRGILLCIICHPEYQVTVYALSRLYQKVTPQFFYIRYNCHSITIFKADRYGTYNLILWKMDTVSWYMDNHHWDCGGCWWTMRVRSQPWDIPPRRRPILRYGNLVNARIKEISMEFNNTFIVFLKPYPSGSREAAIQFKVEGVERDSLQFSTLV